MFEVFTILGLVAIVTLCGSLWWLLSLLTGRKPSTKLWLACFASCLALTIAFTAAASITYFSEPTPLNQRQLSNPGGPSSTVGQAIFVMTMLVIVVPGTYLGLLVLSLLPPNELSRRRRLGVRLFGSLTAVALVGITLWMLSEIEVERKHRFRQRHQSPTMVDREQVDQFEHVRRP